MVQDDFLDVEPDPEIKEEMEAASHLGDAGREKLLDRIHEHNATSPELAAGDIDAVWEDDAVGEELPGGGNPTPDQSIVEEIGEAFGYTYEDNEPLRTSEKLEERDRNRWELDERSAEDAGSDAL